MQSFSIALLLAALSGAFMALAMAPWELWFLAPVSWVPLLLAVDGRSLRRGAMLAVVSGTVGWCIGFPWIAGMAHKFMQVPMIAGYALTLLHGVSIGVLFALCITAARFIAARMQLPLVLTLPLCTVAVWSVFPNIFFCQPAHMAVGARLWLQPIEWVGAYGLDAVLVLVNVLVFDGVRRFFLVSHRASLKTVAIGWSLIVLWLVSGFVLMQQWDARMDAAPKKRIGLVQPARPSVFHLLKPEPGYTRDSPIDMEMSEQLANDGAELVIWPEGHNHLMTRKPEIRAAFERRVKRIGVPLIIHDKGKDFFHKRIRGSVNSSIAITPEAGVVGATHKRMLVPFGEYVPLTDDYKFLRRFRRPGQLKPGDAAYAFDVAGMRVQPLICYETQFGRFVAETVSEKPTGTLLVAQSNDGWFGGKQVYEHLSSDRLRAVETRMTLVHSMNDGPSEAVDAAGRVVYRTPHNTRGAFIVDVPYDKTGGGTLFTASPNVIVNIARVIVALLLIVAWRRKPRDRQLFL